MCSTIPTFHLFHTPQSTQTCSLNELCKPLVRHQTRFCPEETPYSRAAATKRFPGGVFELYPVGFQGGEIDGFLSSIMSVSGFTSVSAGAVPPAPDSGESTETQAPRALPKRYGQGNLFTAEYFWDGKLPEVRTLAYGTRTKIFLFGTQVTI